MLVSKLYEEREIRPEESKHYGPLLNAWFGNDSYDAAAAADSDVIREVELSLEALSDDQTFGSLQKYLVEEHFLYGKSEEEIAKQIAAHADLLVKGLINFSIRKLRHPQLARPVAKVLQPYKNNLE